MKIKRPDIERFWQLVVEEPKAFHTAMSPCWTYIGPDSSGYGVYRTVPAHRFAAAMYCGKVPSKVMMRCGNRRCVRLDHMYISYMVDRRLKVSKLTGRELTLPAHKQPELIAKVMVDRLTLNNIGKLARLNGVSYRTIALILKESPIYDVIDEIKLNPTHRRTPYKTVDSLVPYEKHMYEATKIIVASYMTPNRSN